MTKRWYVSTHQHETSSRTSMSRWIGAIFLLVGLAMGGVAGYEALQTRAFVAVAERMEGVVLENVRRESRDSKGKRSVSYAPRVQYQDRAGVTQEFVPTVSSSPPEFEEGARVTVLTTGDPATARVQSFASLWTMSLVLGILAVVFVPLGALLCLVGFRQKTWSWSWSRRT